MADDLLDDFDTDTDGAKPLIKRLQEVCTCMRNLFLLLFHLFFSRQKIRRPFVCITPIL